MEVVHPRCSQKAQTPIEGGTHLVFQKLVVAPPTSTNQANIALKLYHGCHVLVALSPLWSPTVWFARALQ